jgi:hypothetical protein
LRTPAGATCPKSNTEGTKADLVAELSLNLMANALPLATNLTVSCAVTFTYLVLASIRIVRMVPDSGTTSPKGLLGMEALADKFTKPNVIAITVSATNFGFIMFSISKLRCVKKRYVFHDFFVIGRPNSGRETQRP